MLAADFDELARPMIIKLLNIRPVCPNCGAEQSSRVAASFMTGGRVKCGQCEFYGNWRYGTILHNSRLSNTQFLALFFKFTLPADAPAIAKHLGLDPGTVRDWREKLLTAVRAA